MLSVNKRSDHSFPKEVFVRQTFHFFLEASFPVKRFVVISTLISHFNHSALEKYFQCDVTNKWKISVQHFPNSLKTIV